MKSYTITVNGNVYDVTVEENGAVSAPAAAPRRAAAPAAAPAAKPAAAAGTGSVKQAQQERYSNLRSLSVMPLRRETASWFLRS
jgi:hypothetical protein